MPIDRETLRATERCRLRPSPFGKLRIAVGYPGPYSVAMSSLSFQWVIEIASGQCDVGVERFYADREGLGASFDTNTPLGDFALLAWTCSFELDAVEILRTLDAAGIARERWERRPGDPLLALGGPLAVINPLPLAPVLDLFCLGAAERLLPGLVRALHAHTDRTALLEELADADGFFVPQLHLDERERPIRRLRRLEMPRSAVTPPSSIPASHVVSPHTVYRKRALIEVSRGCPEKCRFCWASHNHGQLRSYPIEAVCDRLTEIQDLTPQIGLVATAVGDHPRLPDILEHCQRKGLDVAVSSLRIPAMRPEVLAPLAACGARSVTIAPETGSDSLRRRLNKPISNDAILTATEAAQRHGLSNLKLYFMVGLPEEQDDDLLAIARLVHRIHQAMVVRGRERGYVGDLSIGLSIFVPKPYTPFQNEVMIGHREARRRVRSIVASLRDIPNLKIEQPSYRNALLQGALSRGAVRAYGLLRDLADGESPGRVLAAHHGMITELALSRPVEPSPWRFIATAPQDKQKGRR